uniref:Protein DETOXIFICATION n=1 Tax=Rehmannia glutinosa TaxID=99300 RepID=A0A482EW67_REHGL|nr:MATE25 [Rehmannia glutinosa]
MEDNNSKQALLAYADEEEDQVPDLLSIPSRYSFQRLSNFNSFFSSFVADDDDIAPIETLNGFLSAFKEESGKLWFLAGPAIFTSLCQYSLGAFTQTFAGHVGTLELAAFSIENSVIAGLSLGVMLGMGSALETLCGQAYGAGHIEMLGVYMQRSWVILLATAFLLMFLYIFALPFLLLIGQTEDISRAAGKFALWMIPQLYAYAVNFPIAKFLQAQSKIMAMAWISAVALAFHVFFSWLLMLKLGWGMAGGAAVLDASWWFIVIAQLIYIFSGTCGKAWPGFSFKAIRNLWGFVRLSLASALMMCLETWYFMALVLFAGYLKDAEVAVAALSVCTNILGWTNTIAVGFNAAISVRVSNELGASHPRTAKFSVVVMVISAFLIGLVVSILLLVFQDQYPSLFCESDAVKQVVYELTPLLAFSIVVNSIQPALSGVAIGAGWQALIAYVNIACYYVFGVPLGLLLGYTFNMGVKGIWYGMVTGTVVQTLILFWIVYRTDWNKEASIAAKRIKQWRGETDAAKPKDVEKVTYQTEENH